MNKNQSDIAFHPILGDFTPIEELLYHDCPYVFTFRDAAGSLSLAYLVSTDAHSTRYLAVRIGADELTELKSGKRSIRSVFIGHALDINLDEGANILSVLEKPIHLFRPDDLPPDNLYL